MFVTLKHSGNSLLSHLRLKKKKKVVDISYWVRICRGFGKFLLRNKLKKAKAINWYCFIYKYSLYFSSKKHVKEKGGQKDHTCCKL